MKLVAFTLSALLLSVAISDAKLKTIVYVCESKGSAQVDDEGKLRPPVAVNAVKFNFDAATGTYSDDSGGQPEKFEVLASDSRAPMFAVGRTADGNYEALEMDYATKPVTFAFFSVGRVLFGGTCEEKYADER
jgi:hypothetical protein